MKRNAGIGICLVVVFALGVALSAGAQEKKVERKAGFEGERVGLVFNLWDLAGDAASTDGLSAGLGLKYWLAEKMALRALLDFEYTRNSNLDTTDVYFGLSGAFEYHFVKGRVSPYTGGLIGMRIRAGDASDLGLALAGLFGVEARVLDSLGLFAEYNLRLYLNEPVFDFELGIGNGGALGVIVYLP